MQIQGETSKKKCSRWHGLMETKYISKPSPNNNSWWEEIELRRKSQDFRLSPNVTNPLTEYLNLAIEVINYVITPSWSKPLPDCHQRWVENPLATSQSTVPTVAARLLSLNCKPCKTISELIPSKDLKMMRLWPVFGGAGGGKAAKEIRIRLSFTSRLDVQTGRKLSFEQTQSVWLSLHIWWWE